MRRSYRLALIAVVVLAGVAVALGRDVSTARPRVEGASGEAPPHNPLQRVAERDEFARAGLSGIPERADRLPEKPFRLPRDEDPAVSGRAAAAAPAAEGEGGLHWIGMFEAADQPLVAAAGIDLSAPRDLTLWKLDRFQRHATPVTELRSEVGRPFLAEHLLLSGRGARLVVAPRGLGPFGPQASTTLEVPPRDGSRRESQ